MRVDEGTQQEMYVWPYFVRMSLAALTPPQKVELFRIVTGADYRDMVAFGVYSLSRGHRAGRHLAFLRRRGLALLRHADRRATLGPGRSTNGALIELEQVDLRVQVGGWDHVREINRQPNITGSV